MKEVQIDRPSQLVIFRHAESERNVAKKGSTYFADEEARRIVRGTPDHKTPITSDGRLHSLRTGVYARERFGRPDYVYHSGYIRTLQTMNGCLEAFPEEKRHKIQIRMNPFIRERDSGHAYDMTTAEAEKAFPWLRDYWKTQGGFMAVPPGGESLCGMSERVYLFLNMLFRDRAGKKIWIFTHGGTLRVFRFILERWSYDQALKWPSGQSPKNCGMTVYNFDPKLGRLVLGEYNTVV